jgi:hypothetical protein
VDHPAALRTASFITQQDIGGDHTGSIGDVELRNAPNTTQRAFMRLLLAPDQTRIDGHALDFGDEITRQIFDRGERWLNRWITCGMAGQTQGWRLYHRRDFQGWRPTTRWLPTPATALCTHRRLRCTSQHPTRRAYRNDPVSARRVGEKKRA